MTQPLIKMLPKERVCKFGQPRSFRLCCFVNKGYGGGTSKRVALFGDPPQFEPQKQRGSVATLRKRENPALVGEQQRVEGGTMSQSPRRHCLVWGVDIRTLILKGCIPSRGGGPQYLKEREEEGGGGGKVQP